MGPLPQPPPSPLPQLPPSPLSQLLDTPLPQLLEPSDTVDTPLEPQLSVSVPLLSQPLPSPKSKEIFKSGPFVNFKTIETWCYTVNEQYLQNETKGKQAMSKDKLMKLIYTQQAHQHEM